MSLPVGTIIQYRRKNQLEYGEIVNTPHGHYQGVSRLAKGTVVTKVVWKKDQRGQEQMEARGTTTLREDYVHPYAYVAELPKPTPQQEEAARLRCEQLIQSFMSDHFRTP